MSSSGRQERRFPKWVPWVIVSGLLVGAIASGVWKLLKFANYQLVHSKLFEIGDALSRYAAKHSTYPSSSVTADGQLLREQESWRVSLMPFARSQLWNEDDSVHICMITFDPDFIQASEEDDDPQPPSERALLCDVGNVPIPWTEPCDVFVTKDEVRLIGLNGSQFIDLRGRILMIYDQRHILVSPDLPIEDVPEFLLSGKRY